MTGAISPSKLRRGPKAVKAPVALESAEQTAFIRWFAFQHRGVLIHSVPNGAHLAGSPRKRAAQMARLKAEGLVEGMPDLHIPEWDVWIEMKRTKGGRLSEEQERAIDHLRAVGDIVIIAFGWEDARAKLQLLLAASEAQS